MISEETGKKAVRAADTFVHYTLIAFFAVLLVLGCYSLWDSQQVYERASTTQWQPYKPVEPEPLSFWELQRINPDVCAWLSVYGTNIDYPVCQGKDSEKYLETNAKGEYSLSGSLFLEPQNARDFSDFATIVYGHHMENNVMFGQLTDYADGEFFTAHEYGNLFVNDVDYGLDFFCYLKADAYDRTLYRYGIESEQAKADYLNMLRAKALHWRTGFEVGTGDRIVLLSTCASGSTNERGVLVGKVCSETFENTFVKVPNFGTGVDVGWGWMGIPWWCWIVLLAFLVLMATILIVSFRRRNHA